MGARIRTLPLAGRSRSFRASSRCRAQTKPGGHVATAAGLKWSRECAPGLFHRGIERDPIDRRGGHCLRALFAEELQRLSLLRIEARRRVDVDRDLDARRLRRGRILLSRCRKSCDSISIFSIGCACTKLENLRET
jgi:hypothetical protein